MGGMVDDHSQNPLCRCWLGPGQASGRWPLVMVTSPDGTKTALCSLFCLLEWVTFQDWPAAARAPDPTYAGLLHVEGEVAA
jgi:hypothetical protein